MRGLVLLAATIALAGCFQAAEQGIENARNASVTPQPQESVAGDPIVSSTPATSTTPTPVTSTPATTSPPSVVVTPPPPAPTPSPTPPPPTPTPTPTVTPPPPTPTPTPPPPTPAPTPTPPPTPPPASWPREGSHVSYTMDSGSGVPDGSGWTRTFANATWTYTSGDWRGTCDAQTVSWYQYATPQWNNSTSHVVYDAAHPPHWPLFDTKTPPAAGATVTAWYLNGCEISSDTTELDYRGASSQSVPISGHATTLATFNATSPHDGVPRDHQTEWLQRSGLVVYSHMRWHYSHASADLTATDAPS